MMFNKNIRLNDYSLVGLCPETIILIAAVPVQKDQFNFVDKVYFVVVDNKYRQAIYVL